MVDFDRGNDLIHRIVEWCSGESNALHTRNEFELQSHLNVYLRTNTSGKYMKALIFPASLLFFYKEGFGIEQPTEWCLSIIQLHVYIYTGT